MDFCRAAPVSICATFLLLSCTVGAHCSAIEKSKTIQRAYSKRPRAEQKTTAAVQRDAGRTDCEGRCYHPVLRSNPTSLLAHTSLPSVSLIIILTGKFRAKLMPKNLSKIAGRRHSISESFWLSVQSLTPSWAMPCVT